MHLHFPTAGQWEKLAKIAITPPLWSAAARRTFAGVEHVEALRYMEVGTLLDVGANVGQFSVVVRQIYPNADIIAFEPQAEAAERFSRVVGGSVKLHCCGVGAKREKLSFHVTERTDSSSLYEPLDGPGHAYGIQESKTLTIDVLPMPDVVTLAECKGPIFMKVDVQGAELSVFEGCGNSLRMIDAIYVELSFVPLYKDQPLAGQVISYLNDKGFQLRGVFNQSKMKGSGLVQADFLFTRDGQTGQVECVAER